MALTGPTAGPPLLSSPPTPSQWSDADPASEVGVSPEPSLLLPSQGSPASSSSALLYMNADFEGGEFIFTEMDAKTVTVSWCCQPNALPQQPALGLWASPGSLWLLPYKEAIQNPAGRSAQTFCALPRGCAEQEACGSELSLPGGPLSSHPILWPNMKQCLCTCAVSGAEQVTVVDIGP